jgi:hypothetical protein
MIEWTTLLTIKPKVFDCGYCGCRVGPDKGYCDRLEHDFIVICSNCGRPTYISIFDELQVPSPVFGNNVNLVPEEMAKLYNEARRCTGVNAYTASVLCCRKLLMNIAVDKGAAKGGKFIEYVEYLGNKGYIVPDGLGWVDHIRKKGNEATHEIELMGEKDAKDLIVFCEMLLKTIYEFPGKFNEQEDKK